MCAHTWKHIYILYACAHKSACSCIHIHNTHTHTQVPGLHFSRLVDVYIVSFASSNWSSGEGQEGMFSSIFENRKKPRPQSEFLADVSNRVRTQQMLWILTTSGTWLWNLAPSASGFSTEDRWEEPLLSLRWIDHDFFMAFLWLPESWAPQEEFGNNNTFCWGGRSIFWPVCKIEKEILGIHEQTLNGLIFLTDTCRGITDVSLQRKYIFVSFVNCSSFIKIIIVICLLPNVFQHKMFVQLGFPSCSEKQCSPCPVTDPVFVCWSVCRAGSCWAALRSIFCPGVHSPFPCRWQMLFYPRGLGTAIINDSRLQLGQEREQQCLRLGHEECRCIQMMRNGLFTYLWWENANYI